MSLVPTQSSLPWFGSALSVLPNESCVETLNLSVVVLKVVDLGEVESSGNGLGHGASVPITLEGMNVYLMRS